MRRPVRWYLLCGLVVTAVCASGRFVETASAVNASEALGDSRLRPMGSYETALLAAGVCLSATIRELVATVEGSDTIVYIAVRRETRRRVAGGLHFVAATASDRILQVTLNANVDRLQVLAILGHELRHVVEIAAAAEVRSREAFNRHYQFHGKNVASLATLDTPAARDDEARVRRDVIDGRRAGLCGS